MNLRGKENRINFVEKYDITPVSHQRLLNGQVKKSVGGSKITNRYYCFLYNRKGESYQKTFTCGYYIAEHLLELTNQEKLPLFNPLKSEKRNTRNNEINNNNERNENHRQRNELAFQLSDAIYLFNAYWYDDIDRILANILREMNKYYYNQTYNRTVKARIKAVNTIFRKCLPNKKMTDVINELSKNNDIKEYNFDLLNRVLEAENIESRFK